MWACQNIPCKPSGWNTAPPTVWYTHECDCTNSNFRPGRLFSNILGEKMYSASISTGDMIWYFNDIVYLYTIISRLSLVYTRIDMYDFDSWGIKRTSTGLPCSWLYSGLKSRSSCHTDQVVLTQVTSNWSTAIAGEFPRGSQEHEQRWNSAGSLFLFLPHMFSKHLKYQRSQRFSCALVHRKANNLRLLGLILREAQEVSNPLPSHTVSLHDFAAAAKSRLPSTTQSKNESLQWQIPHAWRFGDWAKTSIGGNSVWVIVKNPHFS